MNKLFVFSENKNDYTQELLWDFERFENLTGVISVHEKILILIL